MSFRIRHLLAGIAIYASGVLTGQALYALGVDEGWSITGATLAVLGLFALFAGLDLQVRSMREVAPYSISWALLALALDIALIVPVLGWEFLLTPDVLAGYAIIALVPVLPLLFRSSAPVTTSQPMRV